MKRWTLLTGVTVCAMVLAAFFSGCGGSGSNTAISAPTATTATTPGPAETTVPTGSDSSATTAAGSSVTTAAGSSATTVGVADTEAFAKYKQEMQGWVEKYDADLTESVGALEEVTDPLNATDEQIQKVKDFADLTTKAAADLQDIQPPEEVASSHKAYADGVTTMATGFQQLVKAMQDSDATSLQAALTSLSGGDQLEQAETSLEQLLGFKLTSE
ncbi:MAG: hypothetical protein M1274_03235 [Actinobacteria bacterium]|nr:hypothetical protein [Actinomycetota bacterium]